MKMRPRNPMGLKSQNSPKSPDSLKNPNSPKSLKLAVLALPLLALIGLFGFVPAAHAATATATAASNRPIIEDVDYEGYGRVEVDFVGKVSFRNTKVSVKDSTGKNYSARITKKDSDEVDFALTGVKDGRTYRFTISGVKVRNSWAYTSVSGTFKVATRGSVVVEDVEYKGGGKVEVDFARDVYYRNPKVTVKDSSGRRYSARITSRHDDELNFKIGGIRAGRTYTFTVSGVRNRWGTNFTSAKGKFKTPQSGVVTIKEVEYDADDREVSVDFRQHVKYRGLRVIVRDSSGRVYNSWIVERDSDGVEACVEGLRYGRKYTVTVSGVSNRDSNSYKTVSKGFLAVDD